MWTVNFQMFKLVLEKAEEPEIKLPTSVGSLEQQESSRKMSMWQQRYLYNAFQHLAECLTQNIGYILSYPTSKMESVILYKDENKNLYMRYYLTSDSFCMSTNHRHNFLNIWSLFFISKILSWIWHSISNKSYLSHSFLRHFSLFESPQHKF